MEKTPAYTAGPAGATYTTSTSQHQPSSSSPLIVNLDHVTPHPLTLTMTRESKDKIFTATNASMPMFTTSITSSFSSRKQSLLSTGPNGTGPSAEVLRIHRHALGSDWIILLPETRGVPDREVANVEYHSSWTESVKMDVLLPTGRPQLKMEIRAPNGRGDGVFLTCEGRQVARWTGMKTSMWGNKQKLDIEIAAGMDVSFVSIRPHCSSRCPWRASRGVIVYMMH